jgi:hypothetical protein
MTPFLLVATLVLAATGWLAWHVYNQPTHPEEAQRAAVTMTEAVLYGVGGDDVECPAIGEALVASPGQTAVERCESIARAVAQGFRAGVRSSQISNLHITGTQLGRRSGHVEVESAVRVNGNQTFDTGMDWPVRWYAGHWKVSGMAHVTVR